MKNLILALSICIVSFAASAQPISLQAGSSVVINGDVVSCQGPSETELAPVCSIKQDGPYYRLYSGLTVSDTFSYFSDALAAAKKMKEAGLCR